MSEVRQLNLFGPSLNVTSRLKESMRQAIRDSRFSREQVIDRLNKVAASEGLRLGRSNKITLAALDGWLAESKDGNLISVALLPAFCWAVESVLPLKVLAGSLGADVITEGESKILAFARMDIEQKRLARQKQRLQQEIGEGW